MINLKPDQIVIPENRFRREFDKKKLEELKQSILRNGLLHPPTVERQGLYDDPALLRAGERRFRALSEILAEPMGSFYFDNQEYTETIPCAELSDLTDLQRLEIEVEENTVRADFTWQERTAAIAALHKLRKQQNPEQTIAATASEIQGKPAQGSQAMVVSDAMIIQKHIHLPEVAKAKSEKDALKVIQKITTAGHRARIAATAVGQVSEHRLIRGSAFDVLPTLPAESFDVILTDPPYGVGADSFGTMAATGHDYDDSKELFEKILQVFPDESYRVAKERAHAYVFCDVRNFDQLATFMLLAGWKVFPTPLIWAKGNGMLPYPDYGPRRTYECICYCWKGERKVLAVKSDVITIPAVRGLEHGAQKPVVLYSELLSRSANPGDTVLDCFGGTGTILVAANRGNLRATYIEVNESSFNIATLRANIKDIDDGAVEVDGLEDIPL